MCFTPTLAFACAVLAAVPPLSPDQHTQLATAGDFTARFDEAALYTLLHNAVQWRPGDEAGAIVPDYAQILASPESARGQLFLIEGQFNGQPRPIDTLSRPGPWDGKLQQWVIVTNPQTRETAVVYLVDPPPAPRKGAPVRVVARFFKALRDKNAKGESTDFLTFVGKTTTPLPYTTQPTPSNSSSALSQMAPLAVVAVIGLWFLLRKAVRVAPTNTQQRSRQRTQPPQQRQRRNEIVEEEPPPDLPDDPAEALSVLGSEHTPTEATAPADTPDAPKTQQTS